MTPSIISSRIQVAVRIPTITAQKDELSDFPITRAMAPNVARVIESAVAAGVVLALLGS